MSKIFPRRIDPNIPNLTKTPQKVMSVQNLQEDFYILEKIIIIIEIIK